MNARELRSLIVRSLPERAFRPVPGDGLFLVPMAGFIALSSYTAVKLPLGMWPLKLLAGGLAGVVYGALFFLGHETLHGGVFRSWSARTAVGYLAFLVFCLSPTQWRRWHNVFHHGRTNIPGMDPDCYDLDDEQRGTLVGRLYYWLSPGSNSASSYLYLFHFFTMQCQFVLWIQSKYRLPGVAGDDRARRRAIVESMSMVMFWALLSASLRLDALFAVLVPMMVANLVVMSFVATNHFLRPLVDENDPMANTMSVRCWRPYDVLTLHFSHHVEHHLFPSMNWRYRPLVRALLKQHVPDRYVCPGLVDALRWLYRTPRRYKDSQTLVCPYTGRSADLRFVEEQLGKDPVQN